MPAPLLQLFDLLSDRLLGDDEESTGLQPSNDLLPILTRIISSDRTQIANIFRSMSEEKEKEQDQEDTAISGELDSIDPWQNSAPDPWLNLNASLELDDFYMQTRLDMGNFESLPVNHRMDEFWTGSVTGL